MKKSPFKFLTPYNIQDKNIFWGREQMLEKFRQQVQENRLVLLHGAEGVGKSSLIGAGLRNSFAQTENLNLIIRRGSNVLASFYQSVNDLLSKVYPPSDLEELSFSAIITQLFEEQKKPIFLIFEQLEEFMVGKNNEEQRAFFAELASLLQTNIPCKILLVLESSFLGELSAFETNLPTLFSQRFYLPPINEGELYEIIYKTLDYEGFKDKFQIFEPAKITEKIVQKLANEAEIRKLAYAQIYLTILFQKAQNLASANELPLLTPTLVEKKTEITSIFADFFEEKIQILQTKYVQFPHLVWEILATLISSENRKLQRKDRDIHKQLIKSVDYEQVTITDVRNILKYLTQNGILIELENVRYEISYVLLREIVQQKKVERAHEIRNAQATYKRFLQKIETESLNLSDIAIIESQENVAPIPNFLKSSLKKVRKEVAEKAEKERISAEKSKEFAPKMLKMAAFLAVASLIFFFWTFNLHQKAKERLLYAQTEEFTNKKTFNALYFYRGRFALAAKGNKYGFIDKGGNTRIEYNYDFALPFEEEIGLAKVKIRENPNDLESPLIDYLIDSVGTKYRFATQIKDLTPEITALDLRHQQLNSFPEAIFANKQLKVLLLNHNQLQNLPPNLAELSNLEILNVSHNQISNLSKLEGLNKLHTLDISYNKISKMEHLEYFNSLRSLNLSNNKILQLEKLDNLLNLNYLDVSSNQISKKEGLENLKQLKELLIYGNKIE